MIVTLIDWAATVVFLVVIVAWRVRMAELTNLVRARRRRKGGGSARTVSCFAQITRKQVTAADYTIFVRGRMRNTSEAEIAAHFAGLFGLNDGPAGRTDESSPTGDAAEASHAVCAVGSSQCTHAYPPGAHADSSDTLWAVRAPRHGPWKCSGEPPPGSAKRTSGTMYVPTTHVFALTACTDSPRSSPRHFLSDTAPLEAPCAPGVDARSCCRARGVHVRLPQGGEIVSADLMTLYSVPCEEGEARATPERAVLGCTNVQHNLKRAYKVRCLRWASGDGGGGGRGGGVGRGGGATAI